MTLARRHFQRVTAAAASAAADPGDNIDASAYELQLMRLAGDKRRLKQVQSIERKVDIKRQLLPEYEPWVDGVLAAGRGGQDAVLMTVMLWRIDVGDFAGALPIARYALQHGLAMPDQYERSAPAIFVEETSDQALAAFAAAIPFEHEILLEVEELTRGHDMHDQVRAKIHKALGLSHLARSSAPELGGRRQQEAEAALEHLRRALQLNERVGVKKEIERLERTLRRGVEDVATSSGQRSAPASAAGDNAGAEDAAGVMRAGSADTPDSSSTEQGTDAP